MIQRIQTVYFSLSLICMALLFQLPFGEILTASEHLEYTFKGFVNADTGAVVVNGAAITILLAVICMNHIFVIFGYKWRTLQIRLTTINMIMNVGFIGLVLWFYYAGLKELVDPVFQYGVAIVFPLISIILSYLGMRGVIKDETLIKSIDRIR